MRQIPKPYGDRKNTFFLPVPQTLTRSTSVVAPEDCLHLHWSEKHFPRLTAKWFFSLGELPARTSGFQVEHNFFHFFSITTESSEKQQMIVLTTVPVL